MTHEEAWLRLPDLLHDRDEPTLLSHVKVCHACQQQVFRLNRVDRMLRAAAPPAQQRVRVRSTSVVIALAVAALIVAIVPIWRQHASPTQTLRSPAGIAVGRATLSRSDTSNYAVSLELRRVKMAGGDTYVLWTRSLESAVPVPVGRFMVDASGSCKARFTLPAGSHWTRFWVTPRLHPSVVLATTTA